MHTTIKITWESKMEKLIPRHELIPKIKEYIKQHKVVTKPQIARAFGISIGTAYYILEYLISQGFIEKKVISQKVVLYIYRSK